MTDNKKSALEQLRKPTKNFNELVKVLGDNFGYDSDELNRSLGATLATLYLVFAEDPVAEAQAFADELIRITTKGLEARDEIKKANTH